MIEKPVRNHECLASGVMVLNGLIQMIITLMVYNFMILV
jgi:hypothetical protein